MTEVCKEKMKWLISNGSPNKNQTGHAFGHSAPPRGNYCFWCGIHKDGLSRIKNPQEYTEDNWDADIEYLYGKPVADLMTEVHEFYAALSPVDRKRVCSNNPMGHPYPSLLT